VLLGGLGRTGAHCAPVKGGKNGYPLGACKSFSSIP
jgi:hypothetical protein